MYIKKLEYLQQTFKQNYLYSGVILKSLHSLPIGTPCLIDLSSKKDLGEKIKEKKARGSDSVEEINNYFRSNSGSAVIIFLFNTYNDSPDFITTTTKLNKIYYIDDKPLIYDSYSSTVLKSLEDNLIDGNILEQLKSQLNDNRFVNYVFEDVKLSNVNNVISNIEKVIDILNKNYSNNTSFYQYVCTGSRVLIDTVSMSFYKIGDVIPVFNYKKLNGICMEIILTNSDLKGEALIRQNYSMTYKFLFSKHKENTFSIDGELVTRPNEMSILHTMPLLYKLLKKSTPKDIVKSSSKQSVKKEPKKAVKVKKLNTTKEFIYRGNEIYRADEL